MSTKKLKKKIEAGEAKTAKKRNSARLNYPVDVRIDLAVKAAQEAVAVLRDGTELRIGDEVTTEYNSHCRGKILIVEEINPFPGGCESGVMVVAHLKEDPTKKIRGFHKEGVDLGPAGVDANNFSLHNKNQQL